MANFINAVDGNTYRTEIIVRYKECLRNHAAPIMRFALDGCGEFAPAAGGPDGLPISLHCAACGCHRSFHRRVDVEVAVPVPTVATRLRLPVPALPVPPPPPPVRRHRRLRHDRTDPAEAVAALAEPLDGGEIDEERDVKRPALLPPIVPGMRRPKTNLSEEKRERVRGFAERLGWRVTKRDEEEIGRFCSEVGISRLFFRTWVNNNRRRRMNEAGESSMHNRVI